MGYKNIIRQKITGNETFDVETYGVASGVISATTHTPLQTAEGSVFTTQVITIMMTLCGKSYKEKATKCYFYLHS